jgi:hypothetical protein
MHSGEKMLRILSRIEIAEWMILLLNIFGRGLTFLTILVLSQACSPAPNPPTQMASQTQTLESKDLTKPTQAHNVFIPAVQSGGGGMKAGVENTPGVENTQGAQSTPGEPGTATEAAPDPHVEVQADHITLKVGEALTIVGAPVEISNPSYEINVRDPGVVNIPSLAGVTYDNQVTPLDGSSGVLEFVSAEGGLEQVKFLLRAKAPGTTTVTVIATGEIHNPGSGQASWTGQGSGSVDITVTN